MRYKVNAIYDSTSTLFGDVPVVMLIIEKSVAAWMEMVPALDWHVV